MKKLKVYSILSLLLVYFSAGFGFVFFEPSFADAVTDTVIVTQAVTSEITISAPADVTMSPSISGMSGGTGNGTATWTVITNDASGFNLALKASTTPAMQSGAYSFANYTRAGAVPDYTWSVAAADSEFGFTVEPATVADTVTAFKDNGSACGGAATLNAADTCWDALLTTDTAAINRTSVTTSSGEAEVVKFRAQSGASHFQQEGSYTATITATALTN